MSFAGCSRFTIQDGNFTSVGRDQHVNIVQCSHHEKKRIRTILDEYQQVPTGKLYLKCKIAETDVWRRGMSLNARWTFCAANIRGEDENREFMYVGYSGRDAAKAYKLDLDEFSAVKDCNSLQLFGYSNLNTLPALVFYDALIPLSHIWERNKFSTMLYIYFSYRAVGVQELDHQLSPRELWLDPHSGFLRKGPFIQDSEPQSTDHVLINLQGHESEDIDRLGRPSLALQAYSDINVLFEYLNEQLEVTDIIQAIRWSVKISLGLERDSGYGWMLAYLPGAVYHRTSRKIIARYPYGERWYYGFRESGSFLPDALQSAVVMYDGSVRFTLIPSDIPVEGFRLRYDLLPVWSWNVFANSWLSQAHGIVDQLGIGEDELVDCCVLDSFCLGFRREEEQNEASRISTDRLIYLFIRPIPRACDGAVRWNAWEREPKYYWSFDHFGQEEMEEDTRRSLGLPLFATTVELRHYWWDREAYDVLGMVHSSKGFDPASTELAGSIGYVILDVIGAEARFEEVDNEDYGYVDPDRFARGDYKTGQPVCTDSGMSEGEVKGKDEEVILYPRCKL